LFAKEQDMKNEASLFESVIDGLVYDLYFPDDMKKADCYISDEVTQIVQSWTDTTSDNTKKIFISTAYGAFKESKTIQRGLIYSRVVGVVKTINGEKI
jgi:hypothetical protein